MTKVFNHLRAEIIKLKGTPVIYLILLCCLFVTAITIASHILDVHNTVALNKNPWAKIFKGSIGIYANFVITPFVVLLVSAIVLIEHRAKGWKYLFTMPVNRGWIYFYKLFVLLLTLTFSMVILLCFTLLAAFIINAVHPEYEFFYYPIDFSTAFEFILHSHLAVLGVLAVQYVLCLKFKHFIIPLGIGFMGFVLGFILSVSNSKYAQYNFYDFTIVGYDYNMLRYSHRTMLLDDKFSNMELYSIIIFVVVITLGYFTERNKNID